MSRQAILITGAARRVGAAMAVHFARAGYDIALHYNHSDNEARQVQKEVVTHSVDCQIFKHDLSDISGIAPFIQRVHAAMPHCRHLINNASLFERGEFLDTDEALFDRQFDINFKAPFFLTQAFAKSYQRGSVVNILDTDISTYAISHFAYLLSKKSLADFTQMAARALGPDIRVNAVCPGYVLPNSESDAAYIKQVEKELPLKTHARVEDIFQTAHWLTQQERMTGQILFVDGGKHVI